MPAVPHPRDRARRPFRPARAWRALLMLPVLALCGCGTIQYYSQSIAGQLQVLQRSRPVDDVLRDPSTPDGLRQSLILVEEVREFARTTLQLPDNGSYAKYAALERAIVVWNVFAAPELSLDPVQSCFPVAGCLHYRGYFSEAGARRYSAGLERRGFETYVGGVAAYSTLGWFRDPVLDTMLKRTGPELVQLLLHELAHQLLYFRDDPEFNEAFAETVARIGVERWLAARPAAEAEGFFEERSRDEEFFQLVLDGREELHAIYRSGMDAEQKRSAKSAVADRLRQRYVEISRGWDDPDAYLDWFSGGINNARFAAVSTYRELVPGLLRLFRSSGEDTANFYAAVRQLGRCSAAGRRSRLEEERPDATC